MSLAGPGLSHFANEAGEAQRGGNNMPLAILGLMTRSILLATNKKPSRGIGKGKLGAW